MKFVPLKYDYAFKEVLLNESVRKHFISDVTGIPLGDIKSIRITNPNLRKRRRNQKQGILDIALILNDNTKIDIELQIHSNKYWIQRNLFYLASMYTDDLRMGEDYNRLRKCITISILDFNLIEGEEYHSIYTLRDKNGREYTDLFEVHIIELKKQVKGTEAVDDWIRLLNAESEEDLDMIKTANTGVLEAMKVVKTMSLVGMIKQEYRDYLKARRDRHGEDAYVFDEGVVHGKAIGQEIGKVESTHELIIELLQELGPVPEDLREMICEQKDLKVLKVWHKKAAKATGIEEFRQSMQENQ